MSVLTSAFEQWTATGASALAPGDRFPRARVEFEMDTGECCPGVFTAPDGTAATLRVTLMALTTAQEVQATRGITDAMAIVHAWARTSIAMVDGERLSADQAEWFWESIGQRGRQLIEAMYQNIGTISPAAVGKAQASARIQ